MFYRFTLLDRNNVATVIDEPVGFSDISIKISRDKSTHGIIFDYQGNDFQFHGKSGRIIKAEEDVYGIRGEMVLIIDYECAGDYEELYRGKLLFAKYEYVCGDECYAKIPIETTSDVMELTNKWESKVDLQAAKSFDQVTSLTPYTNLPFGLSLPSKGIFMHDKADWKEEAITTVNLNEVPTIAVDPTIVIPNWAWFQIVPQFEGTTFSEFGQFATAAIPEHQFLKSGYYDIAPDPAFETVINGLFNTPPNTRRIYFDWTSATPLIYNDLNKNNFDVIDTFSCDINYSFEMQLNNAGIASLYNVLVIRRKNGTYEYLQKEVIFSALIGSGYAGMDNASVWARHSNHTVNFSSSNTGIHLGDGDYLFTVVCGLAFYFQTAATDGLEAYKLRSISGSVNIQSLSSSVASDAKVFMVNEAISRVSEAITNNKIRMYSDYFGRTDSEPYALGSDGEGSLEAITKGLFIRRQENRIPDKPFLMNISMKDLWEGLDPIHHLGFGVEPDTNRAGFNRLRVENWKYFYSDAVVMTCTGVDKITRRTMANEHYSAFQFGYAKWEAEEYNGLDEFLTKRNYRTLLDQIKSVLTKISGFIASGYAWEVTRRKGENNSKDWRYDNDTFIVCCKRIGGDIVVELGNVTDPENIIDPDTIYNFRISPIRNAMRWIDTIFAGYKTPSPDDKIIFMDGDGNYHAKGEMTSTAFKIENQALEENVDIARSLFADEVKANPLLSPERIIYDYPMSVKDFKAINANRYGRIVFDGCETGSGWIDEIDYKPEQGLASFTLIPKVM